MSHHLPLRLKRRQFLANLLFAGGALTLASLQGAAAAPIEDGWVLPKDLKDRLENTKGSRLDPVPKPQETPPPALAPDGRFVPAPAPAPPPPRPPMPGAIRLPSVQNGKVDIPQPPPPPR